MEKDAEWCLWSQAAPRKSQAHLQVYGGPTGLIMTSGSRIWDTGFHNSEYER